jgi:hypothetical protein
VLAWVTLQWRQVDLTAEVVRLDPGTTKNDEGWEFPFTAQLGITRYTESKGRRTGADAQFGAGREIEITLEKPYRKEPPPKLNKFGIPEKPRYRTADASVVLGISADLLRWRFLKGKYSEVSRDARGRVYTIPDIERMLKHPPTLDIQRQSASRKRWRRHRSK